MPSEYLKEGEPCPLKWEGSGMVIYAVGIDDTAGAYFRVCERVCRDCPFKSMWWHKKDGTVTVRCNARLKLEADVNE